MRFVPKGCSRKKLLASLWAEGLLAFGLTLAGGCIPVSGLNHCFYVLIPYIAALILCGALLWAIGQLSLAGDPMREYLYQETVKSIPGRAMAAAVCSILSVVGYLLFLCLNGLQDTPLVLTLYLCFSLLSGGLSLDLRRRILRETWEKTA